MFTPVAFTLEADLTTTDTITIPGSFDKLRTADGQHVLVAGDARYTAPADFTLTIDGNGLATLEWLSGDTLSDGTAILLGVARVDSIIAGVVGGGGGGSGDSDAKDATIQQVRDRIGATNSAAAGADDADAGLNALTKRALARFTSMVAALGAVADSAWASGAGSIIAILKTIAGGVTDTQTINVAEDASVVKIGAVSYTLKRAFSNATASGDTEVVAAVASKKLAVVGYILSNDEANTARFRSGTTAISQDHFLAANSGYSALANKVLFQTAAATALNINLGSAGDVGVLVLYAEID